jgi:glycosyltransferase involved in cell wall biosynthesis
MDFICFSVNNWERRKARKQQFMLHLARRPDVGRVLYVEPPLMLWRLVLLFFIELRDPANRRRWARALMFRAPEIEEKLFLFTPFFVFPAAHRLSWVYDIDLFIVWAWIRLKLRALAFRDVCLWFYHPFDHKLLRWFKDRRAGVFDWAEKWSEYWLGLSGSERRYVEDLEHGILRAADVVFVVSRRLLEEAQRYNPRSFFLRDGTVPEIFSLRGQEVPEDLKGIRRPIIGYSGSFYDRIDKALIKDLSEALPECSFVFVGGVQADRVDISDLKVLSNIFFLGEKEYGQLPAYLGNFDVCILPYVRSSKTASPTKIFDYLAAGKPAVATRLPDLEEFADCIRLAGSREEFVAAVRQALLDKDPASEKIRTQRARQGSWAQRAQEIVEILNSVRGEKK